MPTETVLDSLEQVVASSSAMMKHYERKMDETAAMIQDKLDDALAQNKREMTAFATENIKAQLETIAAQYKKDMDAAHEIMVRRTTDFNTYLHSVTEKNGALARKSWITVSASLVLMIVMLFFGIWLSWYYADAAKQNKIQAEVSELLAKSDIVRCGDALCAKTGKAESNGYRPIKKR